MKFSMLFYGFLAAGLIFFFPGFLILSGICHSKNEGEKDVPLFLFMSIIISTLLLIPGIAIHSMVKLKMDMKSYVWYLIFAINLIVMTFLFFRKKMRAKIFWGNLLKDKKLAKVISFMVLLFLVYMFFFWLSVDVIPPLQDNTLTTQSTAYGLSMHFIPKTFTDRYISYEFAHPLLMHFYTAASFSLTGHLEKVKYYYDYANKFDELLQKKFYRGGYIDLSIENFGTKRVRIDEIINDNFIFDAYLPQLKPNPRLLPIERSDISSFIRDNNISEDYIPISGEDDVLVNSFPVDIIKKGEYWRMAREVYRLFYNTPYLYPSRLPNIVFTLMSFLLVYYMLFFISQSKILSCLGVVAFGTIPELLILSLGGSTTSISIFAILLIMYFYSKNESNALFVAAFFAGLVEYKIIVVLASICIFEFIKNKKDLSSSRLPLFAVAGFTSGTGVYWLYGMSINRHVFLLDHFQYHFINRVFHATDLGYDGYPDMVRLWSMYIKQTGPFLVLPAFFAMGALLKIKSHPFCRFFPLIFVCGAMAFSIVDWRSTKHLLLFTPALVLSLFLYISLRENIRPVGIICIVAGIVVNIIKLSSFVQTGDMHIIGYFW